MSALWPSWKRSAARACILTGFALEALPRTCRAAGNGCSVISWTTSLRACAEYDHMVLRNRIFKARTKGVGSFTTEEGIEWGVTGPELARDRLRLGLPQEAAIFRL